MIASNEKQFTGCIRHRQTDFLSTAPAGLSPQVTRSAEPRPSRAGDIDLDIVGDPPLLDHQYTIGQRHRFSDIGSPSVHRARSKGRDEEGLGCFTFGFVTCSLSRTPRPPAKL
jgi:hypothetical protein